VRDFNLCSGTVYTSSQGDRRDLQPLNLPALQLLMIVDESLYCATLVTMYDKWQLIVAIKHFGERRGPCLELERN
jgi:hypothetical protein